jgi:hypothetical protein
MSRQPKLIIADIVTPKDGETFAEEWWQNSDASSAMVEAFTATAVVGWPDNDRPAQMRFHDIEDEITERVFEDLRTAVAETFVRITSEVLARERGKQATTATEPPKPEYPPLDPIAPQTEYQHMPDYYANHDIPHVLARIRAGDRFFGDVVDGHPSNTYTDFYAAHLEMLERELQPYALYLALSLIALEDELQTKSGE